MNIQRSFSHTDLALELKDELEESLEALTESKFSRSVSESGDCRKQ